MHKRGIIFSEDVKSLLKPLSHREILLGLHCHRLVCQLLTGLSAPQPSVAENIMATAVTRISSPDGAVHQVCKIGEVI